MPTNDSESLFQMLKSMTVMLELNDVALDKSIEHQEAWILSR